MSDSSQTLAQSNFEIFFKNKIYFSSSTGRGAIACDHPLVSFELILGHWVLSRSGWFQAIAPHPVELEKEIWFEKNVLKWDWVQFCERQLTKMNPIPF